MALRTVVIVICFLTVTALYLIGVPSFSHDMAPSSNDLKIRLSFEPDSIIRVAVHNDNPSQTISFLKWDTPLDPQAINTGILKLEDIELGSMIEGPNMKINRKLPPRRDALIEIPPKSVFSVDVALTSPWIPAHRYVRARMEGNWRAVWPRPASQVTDEELAAMVGDDDMAGEFQSDLLEVQIKR